MPHLPAALDNTESIAVGLLLLDGESVLVDSETGAGEGTDTGTGAFVGATKGMF
jgi:hypothetical protein